MSLSSRSSVIALFLMGWAFLSSPWLTGGLTIPDDAKAHFQAQIQFLATSIHTGQSPFWTPNVFTGSPQIADPQSLIFSPAILIALISPEPSFQLVDFYVFALLAVGGLAVAMFAMDKGWHAAGALVGGLAFSFGASAAWRVQHIGQVQSYVCFALTLWLVARSLDRSSRFYGFLAGLAAASMVAKPDQVALLGCYVIAFYVLHHWLSQPRRGEALRAMAPALLIAGAACLVVSLLPLSMTFLFASGSNRPSIPFEEALQGSLHPASLLTAVFSDLFGAFDPSVDYWGPASAAWGSLEKGLTQNMGQLYIGAVPVALILTYGLARRHIFDREIRFFTAASVFLVLYALGRYTPFFSLAFRFLPGVDDFRRPADATFLIGGISAYIAAYLVHRWLGEPAHTRSLRWLLAAAAAGMVMIAAALGTAETQGKLAVALPPLLAAVSWVSAAFAVMLVVREMRRYAPTALPLLFTAFMVADLHANNGPNESTAQPAAKYEVLLPNCRNETVRFLKERLRRNGSDDGRPRVELAGLGFDWPNIGLIQGFENVFGYNPLRLSEFDAATKTPDTIATPDQRAFTPIFPSYHSMFANLLGLRYIATGVPVERIDHSLAAGDLVFLKRTREAYIYENPDALPRVLFADRSRKADFETLITTGQWPTGFDPTREVLLEDTTWLPEEEPGSATDDHGGKVRLARYENTVVEVEVHATRPGFVVLNDVWHSWWRATVDGDETEILKANVLFRAVQVPAGDHVVRFEFKPVEGAVADLTAKLEAEEGKIPEHALTASDLHVLLPNEKL